MNAFSWQESSLDEFTQISKPPAFTHRPMFIAPDLSLTEKRQLLILAS